MLAPAVLPSEGVGGDAGEAPLVARDPAILPLLGWRLPRAGTEMRRSEAAFMSAFSIPRTAPKPLSELQVVVAMPTTPVHLMMGRMRHRTGS